MLGGNLFNIPYYSVPVLNFKNEKKKKLVNLLKSYPEERVGIQTFTTNRQTDRQGLVNGFIQILGEEFEMISQQIKKSCSIEDIWSVTYNKGDYHSPHNHGSLGLAGILYLDLPNGSSVTNYIQPWNNIETDTTIYYPLPVSEGQIVVVPQFVQHFSPPHNAKKGKKRIISFDMNFVQGDNA
tara:strand:- start:85 stop:630 length:546 start_codon:yes stop_codon:yes gene_type:complete